MLSTGYILPFSFCYATRPLLSRGGTVSGRARFADPAAAGVHVLGEVLGVFESLAASGALGGREVSPGSANLRLGGPRVESPGSVSFAFEDCCVDDRALVVLCHLLLARQANLSLETIELTRDGQQPELALLTDPGGDSTLPAAFGQLPFRLEDEDPESGGYTFEAELERPLEARAASRLEEALAAWRRAVCAGGYGLAPIPPEESYVEPDSDHVTFFGTTVEWTVFKVRADPACIQGIVNILVAFHERCQAIRRVLIS